VIAGVGEGARGVIRCGIWHGWRCICLGGKVWRIEATNFKKLNTCYPFTAQVVYRLYYLLSIHKSSSFKAPAMCETFRLPGKRLCKQQTSSTNLHRPSPLSITIGCPSPPVRDVSPPFRSEKYVKTQRIGARRIGRCATQLN